MEIRTLIFHSSKLLRIINKSAQAPDSCSRDYFIQNKYIGSHDRRFIANTVFFTLRNFFLIRKLAEVLTFPSPADNEYNIKNSAGKFDTELKIIITAINLLLRNKDFDNVFDINESLKHVIRKETDTIVSFADAIAEIYSVELNTLNSAINSQLLEYNKMKSEIESSLLNKNFEEQDFSLFEVFYSVRTLILKSLVGRGLSKKEINDLCLACNSQAKVSLRRNSQKISREEIISVLKDEGINAEKGELSPDCILIDKRQNINQLSIYKKGLVEFQDEGSQLISFCLAPGIGDKVLDACAGAGGKTLHLASIQNDSGQIIATDIEFKRLNEIKNRALRFGFSSISSRLLRSGELPKELIHSFDAVLVDAPCSGTGTVRRLPMAKLRINDELLVKLTKNQLNILEIYSKCVKPGGALVYSTCSILNEENLNVIESFLKQNIDFQPEPIAPHLKKFGIKISGLDDNSYHLSLLPSLHKTDGFFMARMVKFLR